jgi:hypothetical protein
MVLGARPWVENKIDLTNLVDLIPAAVGLMTSAGIAGEELQ